MDAFFDHRTHDEDASTNSNPKTPVVYREILLVLTAVCLIICIRIFIFLFYKVRRLAFQS
jgi:hypothetical protein